MLRLYEIYSPLSLNYIKLKVPKLIINKGAKNREVNVLTPQAW